MKSCVVCHANENIHLKCAGCKTSEINYCSKECQKKDWIFHKQYCESIVQEEDKSMKISPFDVYQLQFQGQWNTLHAFLRSSDDAGKKENKVHPSAMVFCSY